MKEYYHHKFSLIFPMMGKSEYSALVESISLNGLREPIVLFQNSILDGRNRYNACKEAKCKPRYIQFEGTEQEALGYVFDVNYHRRNLNVSKKSCVCAEFIQGNKLTPLQAANVENHSRNSPNGIKSRNLKTLEKACIRFGISRNTATKANMLLINAKHIFQDIKEGKISLMKGYRKYIATRNPLETNKKIIRQSSRKNLINSSNITIPDCFAAPFEINKFIDNMIKNGWKMEMRIKDRINLEGEIVGDYHVNWYGNGFPTNTFWSDSQGELEFRKAVIIAARSKLDKIQLKAA